MLVDSINDKEISNLFEDAKDKIDKVEGQATEKKKQVITNLAKELETKIPQTDTICIEIVNQLRGKVSERFIRECLNEKYKQKIRAENAKKQKQQQEKENKIYDVLAAVTPLKHEEEAKPKVKEEKQKNKQVILVSTDGKNFAEDKKNELDNDNIEENFNPTDEIFDKLCHGLQKQEQQQQQKKPQEQEIKKQICQGNELECLSCQELYKENCDLKDALKETTSFKTADQILPSPSLSNNNNSNTTNSNILDFEFFMILKDIREYMKPLFSKAGDDGQVWFSGKINKNTGKVISRKFGRIYHQHLKSIDNVNIEFRENTNE